MKRLMGTLVGVISLGLGLAGLTLFFLLGIVTSAQAITIQQATIKQGAVVVTGKKAAGFSTIFWESQPVTEATKSGRFKFSTTNLPIDCVGELSDGVSTIDVVISGCMTQEVVVIGVPKTGQTTTYAAGDDGALQKGVAWPDPRFTDNGNGAITDNLTGLIWLQDASCLGQKAWADAIAAATGLAHGTCGLTDGSVAGGWRLPNVNELLSLQDWGRANPPLPAGHPFIVVVSAYWSSTTYKNNTLTAWLANFDFGAVNPSDKTNTFFVTAVRGGR